MKLIKRCLLGDSIKRKYLDEALSFAKDYRNSPGFKERWSKIGNKGVTRRLGSKYDPNEGYGKILWSPSNWSTSNKINSWNNSSNAAYFPSQGFYIGTNKNPVSAMSNWKDLLTHEVGHYFEANISPTYIDSYTKEKSPIGTYFSDLYPIFRKSKSYNDSLDLISNDEDIKNYERDPSYTYYDLYLGGYLDGLSDSLHDGTPTESYADLFLLKKKLLDLGIYDVRKANNPFTKQHLDQFKKKNKDKVRLLDNFSDADVIWMMNNVAQNDTPVKNELIDYAKLGIKFKKLQIGGYVQPSNVLEAINNGSAALGLLEGFGRVMSKILPKWMLKAGTYMSPLNYAAALSKGSINPKVGEEVISTWHPNLLLVARTGEAVFGGKALKNTPKTVVSTAAKAGNKTAKAYLVSKELNSTIKKGLKPAPSKTDKSPYSMDDLISNYNSGKQNLESWWLDRELNTGDPNKLVHFDNGDFKPHFYKNGIHGDKIKGAYVKDGKLIPSGEGEFLRLWWSQGKPFLDSHFRYEQSAYWGLPKRYITVDSNAGDFELMYYSDPVTMRPMPADEIVSNGPVDLSNASIIQKSPFGWWERVKSHQSKLLLDSPASLKFFERKPAKISEAEKAGVSKGERNNRLHGQTLAPYYDYSLINKHYEPWTVNEKGLFVFGSPEEAGKLGTLHFTFNEPVISHMMGSWDDAPTVTLLPYRNVRSLAAPVDMAIMDTFFPNYKGLKISSRGAKTLTGDKKTFDYYKSKGLDVEFSPEMEGLLQQLKRIKAKLELLRNSGHDYFSPEMLELYKQQRTFKDKINSIGVEWSKLHVKPIPSYEKVNALGKAEGFDMEQYPYRLASPKKDAYGMPLEASDTELNYTWQSDPSNHFMVGEHPEVVLKSALNGEYGKVRPEFIKYLEWASKNKADYRKKGGKLNFTAKAKASGNKTLIKRATFTTNTRKLKHLHGGNILPEITITGYRPIELRTYYPLSKQYPWTGHSKLSIPITSNVADEYGLYGLDSSDKENLQMYVVVDKKPRNIGYNLFNNNCADATLNYLNTAFGTKESPLLFTTPGDVRSFAINVLGGKVTKDKKGIDTVLIPRNAKNADSISRRVLDLQNAEDLLDKKYTGSHILARSR